MLASGCLAYLGPFTSQFRKVCTISASGLILLAGAGYGAETSHEFTLVEQATLQLCRRALICQVRCLLSQYCWCTRQTAVSDPNFSLTTHFPPSMNQVSGDVTLPRMLIRFHPKRYTRFILFFHITPTISAAPGINISPRETLPMLFRTWPRAG